MRWFSVRGKYFRAPGLRFAASRARQARFPGAKRGERFDGADKCAVGRGFDAGGLAARARLYVKFYGAPAISLRANNKFFSDSDIGGAHGVASRRVVTRHPTTREGPFKFIIPMTSSFSAWTNQKVSVGRDNGTMNSIPLGVSLLRS